jgi:hypothetical protein
MPWEHCGWTVLDDQVCPDCGLDKEGWTIQLNRTRQFVISLPRQAKTKLATLHLMGRHADEAPLASVAFKVRSAAGRLHRGELDAAGEARVQKVAPGQARLELPGYVASDFRSGVLTFTLVEGDNQHTLVLSGEAEVNQEDQAQALQEAAAEGAPFCEECNQPPAGMDEADQAQALQEAAAEGAPFCEECQKAKRSPRRRRRAAARR